MLASLVLVVLCSSFMQAQKCAMLSAMDKKIIKDPIAIILPVYSVNAFDMFKGEADDAVKLENWMKSDKTWASSVSNTEPVMQVECWMLNDCTWESAGMKPETNIQVENWMLSDASWESSTLQPEQEVSVEKWMLDPSIWAREHAGK